MDMADLSIGSRSAQISPLDTNACPREKRGRKRFGDKRDSGQPDQSLGGTMKYILLLVPCVLAVLTPLYNSIDPVLFGLPFFYWYLLALVPISSIFIYLAWKVERK
jgi:hypothetical protein